MSRNYHYSVSQAETIYLLFDILCSFDNCL